MNAWRIGLAIMVTGLGATGLGLTGCAPPLPPPPPAPVAAPTGPAVSYDGTYRGTIKMTGTGAGVPIGGCNTSPRFTLQVANNAFTYQQPHPNERVSATGNPSVDPKINALNNSRAVYVATIAQNGTFSGQSQVAGTIAGSIVDGHMAGTIEGIVCVYAFTADRI